MSRGFQISLKKFLVSALYHRTVKGSQIRRERGENRCPRLISGKDILQSVARAWYDIYV